MRRFETTHLVKSEDMNHHGSLFAARGASWFIEAAYIAGAADMKSADGLVLRTVNEMNFLSPVRIGEIIIFYSQVVFAGTTSLIVAVSAEKLINHEKVMQGFITFVSVDEKNADKQPHHIRLDEVTDQNELHLRSLALQYTHN